MHREIVERRGWLTEQQFLHALNFCMLLPGPEAQQLATYLGWRLHGWRGGIAAGGLFVLPAAAILLALSWGYMAGASIGWLQAAFHGLAAAVIALVASAVRRVAARTLTTAALKIITLCSFAAMCGFGVSFVLILALAATAGWLGGRSWPHQFPAAAGHAGANTHADPRLQPCPAQWRSRTIRVVLIGLLCWWLPVLAVGCWLGWQSVPFQQGLFFSKAALVTVGGAYAVLPYVAQLAVDHYGWLTQQQMIAGLGLAETTPGPLVIVLQFVGFVAAWQQPGPLSPLAAGVVGSFITTWVTFLPGFLLVFLGAPYVEGLGRHGTLGAILTAITAAVVGVMLHLAVWFARHAIWPPDGSCDVALVVATLACWLAMERWKLGVVPTLACAAVFGVAQSWF